MAWPRLGIHFGKYHTFISIIQRTIFSNVRHSVHAQWPPVDGCLRSGINSLSSPGFIPTNGRRSTSRELSGFHVGSDARYLTLLQICKPPSLEAEEERAFMSKSFIFIFYLLLLTCSIQFKILLCDYNFKVRFGHLFHISDILFSRGGLFKRAQLCLPEHPDRVATGFTERDGTKSDNCTSAWQWLNIKDKKEVNQISSVTESIEAVRMSKQVGRSLMASHRSGKTEDTSIVDLSVGLATGQIKTGAPCRSECLAKYN